MNRAMEHPDWAAFVAAIVANPDDDTARLVAADFLEENGDPDRAAFIRVQVELSRLESIKEGKSSEADQLRAKERGFMGPFSNLSLWAAEECPELVKLWGRRWGRDPLDTMSVEGAEKVRWHRGFIDLVRCSAQEWQQYGAMIRKRLPVRVLLLTECGTLSHPDLLGMLPTFLGLTELVCGGGGANEQRGQLLRSQLPGVRVISSPR